jgi:hypothetical protein
MYRTAAPLIATLAALLLIAPAFGASQTFTDAVGDAGGAPDITTVDVSSDATGLTFVIHTTNASSWTDAAAILSLDTDANPATGNAGGVAGAELSYVLHSQHDEFTLDYSDGTHVAHPAATAVLSRSQLTINVPFSEMGNANVVGFRIETPGPSGSDHAPEIFQAEWMFSTSGPLALTVSKTGAGTVSSRPAGISCGTTCSHAYTYGTAVTLTATATNGSALAGWSGACTGTGKACHLSMTSALSATATFAKIKLLTVTKAGKGVVTSNPAGISCGSTCAHGFAAGTVVTLTAAPKPGSVFTGWSGACTGTGDCVLTMSAARKAKATFAAQS